MTDVPVLAAELRGLLTRIGARLVSDRRLGPEVAAAVDQLDRIDPLHLPRAEQEIVTAAGLSRWRTVSSSLLRPLFAGTLSDADQLRVVDRLEWLFLFHRDGHLREAALRRVAGPIASPFLFAAIAWRLNDWVPAVRRAASACAERTFAATSASVVAAAAPALIVRGASWRRWATERAVLDSALSRPTS